MKGGRAGLRWIVPAVLSCVALSLGACARRQAGPPPSVLLVTFDTLRADHVGCYGCSRAETPQLDRLAADGTRFDEARSHVPLTLPSHATMLTGRLPPHHGIRENGLFRLRADVPTLASGMRERGYATAAVVASVVLDRTYGLDRGFDAYDDNQRVGDKAKFGYLERSADQIADSVARVLPELKPPFFLWVHMYDPHLPWVPPAPYAGRHPGNLYDGEIAYADAAFGRIRDAASARAGGELLVVATADHGESLGEHGESRHGYSLHRGVLRVPLIVAGPGIPAGRVVGATVGLVDVAPTIAGLAGAALPGADGTSLARFWNGIADGEATGDREPVWEETLHPLYESGWAPLRGLLMPAWHFVDAPSPELYSRASDPNDRNDVAASRPDVVQRLQKRLADSSKSLGDTPEPRPDLGERPDDRGRLSDLAALGYAGEGLPDKRSGARLDPKVGLRGMAALEEAEKLFWQGRGREALDRVEPFTKTDPDNPRIWHARGKILAAIGEGEEAQKSLARALALDPRSESIRFAYADLLRTRGDVAGSRAELERILAANPKMAEAALALAASFDAEGDAARAESVLTKSYEAGVRDPDMILRLAEHLARSGSAEVAAKRYAEVLELRPGDPEALLETGRAALREGDAARAIEPLSLCAEGPRALACRLELARAYLLVRPRDVASARSTLTSAKELAKTPEENREVEEALRALDQTEAPR